MSTLIKANLKSYRAWKTWRRLNVGNISIEWMKFENYLKDIGPRPELAKLARKDQTKPWGKGNYFWKTFKGVCKGNPAYNKQWRALHPTYDREHRYKTKYGISLTDYEEMLKLQNHRCAICDKHESQSQQGVVRQLAVDHCHGTKAVRKLLCNNCNAILGHAGDSGEILAKCILYLAEHSKDPLAFIKDALKPILDSIGKDKL